MATYLELANKLGDQDLLKRCAVALIVVAEGVKDSALADDDGVNLNTPANRLWARYVLDRPMEEARKVLSLLLADNKDASLQQIDGVSDESLQTLITNLSPYLVQARADR